MDYANSSNVPACDANFSCRKERPSGDLSLPSIAPALRDQASASTGSGSLLTSEIMTAPDTLRTAHPPSAPRTSPPVRTQSVRTGDPASRDSSPRSAHSKLVSTDEPQSHFSAPFTSTGPASTLLQVVFDKRTFAGILSPASIAFVGSTRVAYITLKLLPRTNPTDASSSPNSSFQAYINFLSRDLCRWIPLIECPPFFSSTIA